MKSKQFYPEDRACQGCGVTLPGLTYGAKCAKCAGDYVADPLGRVFQQWQIEPVTGPLIASLGVLCDWRFSEAA